MLGWQGRVNLKGVFVLMFCEKKSSTISLQDVFIQARKFFKKFMVNLINPFKPNKSQS